jgi:hypothetical protein
MRALYRWLIYLYPPKFRRDFGEEMNCVFADASAAAARAGFARQLTFAAHEIAGILRGAIEEQIRSISGLSFVSRRIAMTSNRSRFRFPVAGIVLMVLSFAGLVLAIRYARDIAISFAGTTYAFQGQVHAYQPERISVLLMFGVGFGATLVCAVVVWAVLFAMHRSGVHRLSDAQTWPQQ